MFRSRPAERSALIFVPVTLIYNSAHPSTRGDVMKLSGLLMSGILLSSTLLFGQAAPAPAQAGAAVGHGSFPAKVTKTLDSSKLKDGDAFEVETAETFKLPDG